MSTFHSCQENPITGNGTMGLALVRFGVFRVHILVVLGTSFYTQSSDGVISL
jgi:hypothetical protein